MSFKSVVTGEYSESLNTIQNLGKYQLKEGDVIIVDEAGMVGTSDWQEILEYTKKFKAKLIAVGDNEQFKPISSGDCFRQFIEKTWNVPELETIRRQSNPLMREASVEFSNLDTTSGLIKYDQMNRIHGSNNVNEDIAKRYIEHTQNKDETIVVLCSTNKQCEEINGLTREKLKEAGYLKGSAFTLDNREYMRGDRIIFKKNDKEIKNGELGTYLGSILGVIAVKTDKGDLKLLNTRTYREINHAYAMTLHKSQGKTFDNVIVTASKYMDAKACYVAMTRHRNEVNMYYSRKDFYCTRALINSLSRYEYKEALNDYRPLSAEEKQKMLEAKKIQKIIENAVKVNSNNIKKNQEISARYKELKPEIAALNESIETRKHVLEYLNLQKEMEAAYREIEKTTSEKKQDWTVYNSLKEKYWKLSEDILKKYDAHEKYLKQAGITRSGLEIASQIKPSSKEDQKLLSDIKAYISMNKSCQEMLAEMRVLDLNHGYIKDQEKYAQYESNRDTRDELGKRILSDYKKYYKFALRYDVSRKELLEQQAMYKLRHEGKDTSRQRLDKLSEIISINNLQQNLYDGQSNKQISDEMFKLYINPENLSHTMREYANIIFNKLTEKAVYIKPEYIDQAIKQGLCYEALRNVAMGNTASPEKIQELHARAENLSENLNNLEVLTNRQFLKQRLHDEITPVRKLDDNQISLINFADHMDGYEKEREDLQKSSNEIKALNSCITKTRDISMD